MYIILAMPVLLTINMPVLFIIPKKGTDCNIKERKKKTGADIKQNSIEPAADAYTHALL